MKYCRAMLGIVLILALSACGVEKEDPLKDKIQVGVMLEGSGLGDQSFSDLAFEGLKKARDEDGIIINYLEVAETDTYKKGLERLVNEGNDLVIALGASYQEILEELARKHPKQQFVIIDTASDADNITSITFKEDEGSMLAGIVAAKVSNSQTVGFIGGLDFPVIERFKQGFIKGAKSVNPDIKVLTDYAGSFDDDKLGAKAASKMIDQKADVLYAAAGYAGVGMLKEAEKRKVYAIGVDSDQYFIAENAVITSMQKNLDVALYNLLHSLKETGEIPSGHIELGLKENAVGLAPFRVMNLTDKRMKDLEKTLEQAKSDMN